VTKRAKPRAKRIPQRTCVGCRTVNPKRTLMRLVRTPEGVIYDPGGKASGRGAYLHNSRACWEQALKGALGQALKTEISADDRLKLKAIMDTLPAEQENTVNEANA